MMINMEDSNDCSEPVERQQRQATFKHVIWTANQENRIWEMICRIALLL